MSSCVLMLLSVSLLGCSGFTEWMTGGMHAITPEESENMVNTTKRIVDSKDSLGFKVDIDSIYVNLGDNSSWYSYSFNNIDKAYGVLMSVNKKNEATVQYNLKTSKSRFELIDYMNEVLPENKICNPYVYFYPVGISTPKYILEQDGMLRYYVWLQGYDPDGVNRSAYFKAFFKSDYLILKKAMELLESFEYGDEEIPTKLQVLNIDYFIAPDKILENFADKGARMSEVFASLERSSAPSGILLQKGDFQPKVIHTTLLKLVDDEGNYIKELDSEDAFLNYVLSAVL
jgi:hypothetical protein